MISAIFQPEVNALESQVLALQATIAAHTARIALLSDAELTAGDSLESLKAAIQKVSSLAPSAVSNLRAAVLNLFTGDDSNDDGNGNEPQPEPQPSNDGGEEVAIAVKPEALAGQSTEWASPWACPLASPLTSAFACSIIEDAPAATLEVIPAVAESKPYVELVPVSHSVAYQRRVNDGEIICCYLAGNNKTRLKSWGEWLCLTHSVGNGFELREAKRLDAFKHEIKVWGMNLQQIQRLAETDTTKSPPSRYHVASQPVAERLLAPQATEPTEEEIAIANESIQPPAPTASALKYNPYPMGRRGAAANWEIYQAHKAEQRRTAQTAVMEAPQPTLVESKIVAGDWVELIVNGERCQVEEVSSQGIYILTDDGTANVQEDEVKLLLHVPDSWKPF